jgi:uncharacterized membrane protein
MYDVALFLHLLGVITLVIALAYTLGGLFRAQRASDIAGIRSALGFVPLAERLIPPAMVLILAAGLFMVGDGHWGWGTGWVDVAIAVFVLMSVLGPAVESKRTAALRDRVSELPDGPVPAEVEALRRDPVLTHVALFGSSQIVAFLFLMTNKPSLAGAIAACAVAGAASVPLARAALRPQRTAAAPEPGATAETVADAL